MERGRLLLLGTGGTIASIPGDRGLRPGLSADELLKFIEHGTLLDADIQCEDILSIDSSNMQPEEWLIIAEEIKKRAATGLYDGIVLTHGTDTMAYTASALTFLLMDLQIPVVLTGSQKPIIEPDSDGRHNLADAITAARELKRGVYICFDHAVMLGCRAVKTHTYSLNAFESINHPYIGVVLNGRYARLYDEPNWVGMPNGMQFNCSLESAVGLIKLIPGTSPAMLESAIDCGLRGVVIESFGMGGVHSIRRDHNRSIQRLMDEGLVVVLASQCLNETSSMEVYEVSSRLRDAGVISARDMTTEAAVAKLMWGLKQTDDTAKLRQLIYTNLRDEIA